MAMDAKQAAELVNQGKFDDVDALYGALSGSKEYAKEFSALLKYIDIKVKQDISQYLGLATAAEAVEKLDEKSDPLNEEDQAFAEMRAKLDKIELYETAEENGKQVTRVAEGAARDKMIAQMVAAAKLETKDELRGAASPESPTAKKFMKAADDKKREDIYKQTLNEKIDLAILQSFLAGESIKINQDMQKKYTGDETKVKEAVQKELNKRSKEIKKKISDLGRSTVGKISIAVDGVVGYCAAASVRAESRLEEYKHNVKKLADRINQGFAKLKDKGKDLRGKWQTARANANKKFEACNRKMANTIAAFNEGCTKLWKNKYEIARKVVKYLDKNKYEIGADMVAAAGFTAAVGIGGPAAIIGGAAYAAYTIGRRIIYEAYKQKKEAPNKSYKDIYFNPKFITKSIFSVGAAGLSMGIAGSAAAAGVNVIADAAGQAVSNIAAQKMARRGLTIAGALTSNLVGVATAKNKDERKKEAKSLGVSALTSGLMILLTDALGRDADEAKVSRQELLSFLTEKQDEGREVADSLAGNGMPADTAGYVPQGAAADSLAGNGMPADTAGYVPQGAAADSLAGNGMPADTAGYVPQGAAEENIGNIYEDEGPVMQLFPEEWDKDMGISKRQFDILKSWYEKLDTTDGAGMARFYSHADYYAKELSIDPENPMTAEQILFKFSRLAAITSVKDGEYGTIGTGSLGKQLEDIYHLLGCGDQLTAEQMEVARKTLDICTLNEAGRADGRMDANKFFAVAGAGYRNLPVDEDGTLTMTRNIRVIGEGTDCPEDKRVMYEEVPTKEEVVEKPKIARVPPLQRGPEIRGEIKTGSDVRLTFDASPRGGDEVINKESYIAGAVSQTGERPGIDGARALNNLNEENATELKGRRKRQAEKMWREIQASKGKEI